MPTCEQQQRVWLIQKGFPTYSPSCSLQVVAPFIFPQLEAKDSLQLTKATPGHNWFWIPNGHTLKDDCLVERSCHILGASYNGRLMEELHIGSYLKKCIQQKCVVHTCQIRTILSLGNEIMEGSTLVNTLFHLICQDSEHHCLLTAMF